MHAFRFRTDLYKLGSNVVIVNRSFGLPISIILKHHPKRPKKKYPMCLSFFHYVLLPIFGSESLLVCNLLVLVCGDMDLFQV